MAFQERDTAPNFSSPDSTQPLSTRLARSDKPVLVSRHQRNQPGFRRASNALSKDDDEKPTPRAKNGGWMGASGARMGLGEAFQRTDENGRLIPRQRPSSKDSSVSDSRIPRTKTFSPSLSLEKVEGQALFGSRQDRSVSVSLDSESDTGTRDGSPSPAPKGRKWNTEGSGSDASQLSLVEDPTLDHFDRKMSQLAKDQERMKNIMASQKGLFARGDVGPKVAETTRTLARKSSAGSFEAEPPVQPPKDWGSKARKNAAWMQTILSPDTSLEIKNNPEAHAPVERRRAVADVALPSVEDLSLSQNPTPPTSRPASAQPNSASPEKSQFWNADDFTAQSLQITTSPLLRVRSTKLDEVRSREIQSLTARAIATTKLSEIKERNSEDRSFNSDAVRTGLEELQAKETQRSDSQAEEQPIEMTILEEEGERIRGTPITVFTRSAYESQSRSGSSSRERSKGSSGRPNHSRDNSRELLRKLSRAASNSPVPSIPEKDVSPKDEQTGISKKLESTTVDEKPGPVGRGSSNIDVADNKSEGVHAKRLESSSRSHVLNPDAKRYSRTSTPPKSDVDPEERIDAEARLFDLQDNKSERNSVKGRSRSPSPPSEDGQLDETPRPKIKVDPLSLPTPKVTGAYIETPAQTVRKPRKSRSISPHYEVVNAADTGSSSDMKETKESRGETSNGPSKDRPRRGLRRTSSHRELVPSRRSSTSRPPLINTAKPISIADDLRRIQQEAQIEDSTLDDFDALLTAEAAAAANTHDSTTILEPVIDLEYDERGNPLSEKAIERRLERIHLERMSQSIKHTSSSIRDARQGIERLEEQVSSSIPSAMMSDDAVYIKIPVPRLWVSQPPREPGMRSSWKFTRLGFILAILLAWYLSESAMCSQFCHPEASRYNTWQPSDPFFPWAIPTKLDQWTGSIVSTTAVKVWNGLGGWKPPPTKYRGGPLGANDWWLGRDGPVGLVFDEERDFGSIFMDETID